MSFLLCILLFFSSSLFNLHLNLLLILLIYIFLGPGWIFFSKPNHFFNFLILELLQPLMNRSLLFLSIEKDSMFISNLERTNFFHLLQRFLFLKLLFFFLLDLEVMIQLSKSIVICIFMLDLILPLSRFGISWITTNQKVFYLSRLEITLERTYCPSLIRLLVNYI